MQQEFMHSRGVWDKVLRRQKILAKQLEQTAAIVAQISYSQALHEENWDKYQQLEITGHAPLDVVWDEEIPSDTDAHTSLLHQLVQGRELICDELFPSLATHADYFSVDGDESIHSIDTQEAMLQQLAMGMGDENTKGYVHVLLDGMTGQDVAQQTYEESSKVVWDEEMSTELDMNNDLLQLLASGEGYPDDMQLVDGSSGSMEFGLIDADHVFVRGLADSKVVWDDNFQHSDDKLPGTLDDELPADFVLHGELLKQLTSRMECIDDKKSNPTVWLDTYQLPTTGVFQEGSKFFLPINKWSDSSGDLESPKMHMLRAQTSREEANLTDNGHMEPELGAPDCQLCEVTLEVSVGYLSCVLQLDIASAQDFDELSTSQEMNHSHETFAISEENHEVSDLQIVLAESQQWIKLHTCKVHEAPEIPNLNKYNVYKVAASSRRQWDPGIMQLHVIQLGCQCQCCHGSYSWTICSNDVCKHLLNTTAWGQAVFRDGGNVMTHMWSRRGQAHPPKF